MRYASLVIITQNGKVLLGEKKTGEIGKGTLNGPGGKLEEKDEDLLDCAIRETKEEMKLRLDRDQMEKNAVIIFFVAGEPFFEVHVFRTSAFEGEVVETKDMIPEWHENSDLPFSRMLKGDASWFQKAVEGEKFNAIVFYGETLKEFDHTEFLPFEDTEIAA